MFTSARIVLVGALASALLSGCGSSSHGYMAGSISTTQGGGGTGTGTGTGTGGGSGGYTGGGTGINGVHNTVIATPPTGMVSAKVGAKITANIVFTTNDGNTASGLSLSNGAGFALPAGWTAPAMFGCATVSTGSSCVLTLTYQPTTFTATPKTLTLGYIFIDNSGSAESTDSMGNPLQVSFQYQATSNDNVAPTLSPTGQINATVGSGTQTVTATFVTDDGAAASNLVITSDPATLPAGWSAPSTAGCATVSAGTACALTWSYAPSAPDAGTIGIAFSYNDDSGTPKMGTFNIPYAATSNNNVTHAATPTGPLVVSAGSTQAVTVVFTTDDGYPATNMSITSDLTALPTGWSAGGATSFACASVSTGTSCTLNLSYAPTATTASSTLSLGYAYTDNAGQAKTGTVMIQYSSP